MEKRKGFALANVVITMFFLTIAMMVITTYFVMNFRATIHQQNRYRAYYCALGGIEIGTAILKTPNVLSDGAGGTRTCSLLQLYGEGTATTPTVNQAKVVIPKFDYHLDPTDINSRVVGDVTITISECDYTDSARPKVTLTAVGRAFDVNIENATNPTNPTEAERVAATVATSTEEVVFNAKAPELSGWR